MPLSAYPMCIDAETYSSCVGAIGRTMNYNRDLVDRRDIERYSDIDANPYVVGSQAWNLAHGLPIGPGWAGRNVFIDSNGAVVAPAGVASGAAIPAETGNATGESAPSLMPFVLIGILALMLIKR